MWKKLLFIEVHKVSSVSAQKLRCLSLAWLCLAQLGKFQLELITNRYHLKFLVFETFAKLFKIL